MRARRLRSRSPRALASSLFFLFASAGCNALIGATDPVAEQEEASLGDSCLLNSDCTTPGQVCIFRVCSPPCHTDSDCAADSRCLKTAVGTACVANAAAGCGSNGPCPTGATCQAGSCRNPCAHAADCLPSQQCVNGSCVGTDPTHDPGLDGGVAATDAGVDQAAGDVRAGDAPSEALLGDGSTTLGTDATTDATVDGSIEAAAEAGDAARETGNDGGEAASDAVSEATDAASDGMAEAGCGDITVDVHHCGACGHDCTQLPNVSAAGLACVAGHCSYQCAAGYADCAPAGAMGAGCATDLSTNPNCGGCGITCSGGTPLCAPSTSPGTYACSSGCSASAPTLCNTSCVDTTTSASNCGKCGVTCGTALAHAMPICTGSTCGTSCVAGYSSCAGACVDETSDDQNCGGCGTLCPTGEHCVGSACQCGAGMHVCGGACVANDDNACGASCTNCASAAPAGGGASCNGTQCVSSCNRAGDVICSNVCVDETMNGNCGACGKTCTGSTPYCASGGCVACVSGMAMQCAATGNTPQSCVNDQWVDQTACSGATPVCSGGACVACVSGTQCANNWVQSCVNDQWQNQTMCTATQVCRSAACVPAIHDVGWDTALSSSFSLSANYLYLFRLPALAHNATLLAFGAYGNATGANAKLVLYADNGMGTAPAGAALAQVVSPLALYAGNGTQNAIPMNTTLASGSTYWVGIVVDTATTIYEQADNGSVGTGFGHSYNTAFPAGSLGSSYSGIDLAIYINVQDLN